MEHGDPFIDRALLHEQHAERNRGRLRHVRQPVPLRSQRSGLVAPAGLQQRRGHDVQAFRGFPECGPHGLRQLQGLPVVPLLDLRAREREPR